jgi:hypothetical protein
MKELLRRIEALYPEKNFRVILPLTLADTCDALLWFGPQDDDGVGVPEGFYETHAEYAAELKRRRAMTPRIADWNAYF